MAIHGNAKFATYYRKSNKHNWILGLLANDDFTLNRAITLNKKDFPNFQHAYVQLENDYNELDDLPKNAMGLIII